MLDFLLWLRCCNVSNRAHIWLYSVQLNIPIRKFVYGHWQMSRWGGTAVFITIIFWYQVYVMENEAFILVKFQWFLVTNIKQHGTVEWSFSSLFMEMQA